MKCTSVRSHQVEQMGNVSYLSAMGEWVTYGINNQYYRSKPFERGEKYETRWM
jgi:hypothetical protein